MSIMSVMQYSGNNQSFGLAYGVLMNKEIDTMRKAAAQLKGEGAATAWKQVEHLQAVNTQVQTDIVTQAQNIFKAFNNLSRGWWG